MNNYTLQGFVLKRYNVGEADRLIVFFSLERGLISLRVKGVRKGGAKLAGHLEPFCETSLRLAKGRSLDVIIGANAKKIYLRGTTQLDLVQSGYIMLELCSRLLAEHQPNERAYELLRAGLGALDAGVDTDLVTQWFELQVLSAIGAQPELFEVSAGMHYYLDYSSGHVVSHKPHTHYGLMNEDIIKFWRLLQRNDIAEVARVKGYTDSLEASKKLLSNFLEYHFHIQLKSRDIFEKDAL